MFFKTDEEKKSTIVTTILFVIMILIMSISIFPPEPPELEGGGGGGGTIALNFGFDAEGMGDNYTSADPVSVQSQEVSQSNENEILTSDNADAVATKETPKKDNKKTEIKKPDTKTTTTKTPEKQVDKAVSDILKNMTGDGNSNKAGNQGDSKGGLNNEGYDGSGGTGGGEGGGDGKGKGKGKGDGEGDGEGGGKGNGKGNGFGDYKLSGRKVLTQPDVTYNCNVEGTVVVEISVDKTGKVVNAKHTRGGRNDVKCLVDVAIQAALKTKFDSSTTANNIQIGTITYNFNYNK